MMQEPKVDFRKDTISLNFGEEEMKFHFSKFKDMSIKEDVEEKEEKTIAELAAIFLRLLHMT